MASSNEVTGFVGEALTRGASRGEVEEALRKAGWSADVIQGALAAYADVPFVLPVPRPRPSLSARETCLYLLLFGTLYITAFNTGLLAFLYIDQAFPPARAPESYAGFVREQVRWALSSVIVAFPVFLWLAMIAERDVRRDPVKQRSSVRRWLMYLTVFLAASFLIGDVIALVYTALGGELRPRVALKMLVIAVIAGTIVGHYSPDLRLDDTRPAVTPGRRTRGLAIAVAVIVSIVVMAARPVSARIAAGAVNVRRGHSDRAVPERQ